MVDIAKLQALAAEKGEDQTEVQSGGGGTFELPVEATGGARLISYIEIGKHSKQFGNDKPKEVEQVILEFELCGPKWPATNEETGREKPFIIRITENKSLNEKANFYRLFSRLKGEGDKHFSQLVGRAFKVTVTHSTSGEGDEKRTYANLRTKADGYTIFPAYVDQQDDEGNVSRRAMKVREAITPLKIFLWEFADKEQWDSIFIDGMFGEKKDKDGNVIEGTGQSKNWIQARITSATNFKGSPIEGVIGGSDGLDLGEAEDPKKPATKKVETPVEDEVDPLAEE